MGVYQLFLWPFFIAILTPEGINHPTAASFRPPTSARQVPLSKDEALAAVQRSKVLKGLSIHGQAALRDRVTGGGLGMGLGIGTLEKFLRFNMICDFFE